MGTPPSLSKRSPHVDQWEMRAGACPSLSSKDNNESSSCARPSGRSCYSRFKFWLLRSFILLCDLRTQQILSVPRSPTNFFNGFNKSRSNLGSHKTSCESVGGVQVLGQWLRSLPAIKRVLFNAVIFEENGVEVFDTFAKELQYRCSLSAHSKYEPTY